MYNQVRICMVPKTKNRLRFTLRTKSEIREFIQCINAKPINYNFNLQHRLSDDVAIGIECYNDKLVGYTMYINVNPILNVSVEIPDNELEKFIYTHRKTFSKLMTQEWYRR